tara:strand:+ start:542 stop:1333 length:792 start_codon:yes stop_codon:yes gene_type:complete
MKKFLVVGMKKSGTTYLHEQMRALNQIYVPPLKETHFLLNNNLDRRTFLFKDYIQKGEKFSDENDHRFLENLFVNLPGPTVENYIKLMSSNCEISGECDPELILLENEKIRVLAQENFKIVCILRHPVDRFFSHVKMIIPDKNKNPNQIIKTILANDVKELQHQVNHSCYQVLIHKWKSIYDSSNLLFVDDKNLRNKKKKTMEKILSFISDEAFSRLDDDQLVDDKNVGSKWVLDGDLREALNRFFEKDIDSYQSEINNISYP